MQDSSNAFTQLALDLSWSWSHSADEIWKRLDSELWQLTANPWLILQSSSQRKLDSLTDAEFRGRVEQLLAEVREKNAAPAWFQIAHPSSPLHTGPLWVGPGDDALLTSAWNTR
jgi:starch phosphorylase